MIPISIYLNDIGRDTAWGVFVVMLRVKFMPLGKKKIDIDTIKQA